MWNNVHKFIGSLRGFTIAFLLLATPVPLLAETLDAELLAELSLEELMAIDITTVSDQAKQALSNASANFIITAEDIRRSGRHTIPEILRMAPGVHVGRINSNQWAVGLRGFNDRFNSTFLVLLDGRSLFLRSLPGINWEQVDAVLHDIDHIEIIRGPGASLWGSNAVHGVINIVTKSAKDSQGTRLKLSAGSHTDSALSISHGGQFESNSHYRVYAQRNNYSAFDDAQGQNHEDDWSRTLLGFRYDWQANANDTLRISGEVGRGTPNYLVRSIDFTTIQAVTRASENTTRNNHLLGQWTHRVNDKNQFELQLYYEGEERRSELLNFDRDTFDIDFKQQVQLTDNNTLIWGVGYLRSNDRVANTTLLSISPNNIEVTVKQAFIQNEIKLGDYVRALIGAKFEDTSLSNFEIQPSLKLSWDVGQDHHSWASIAKAVRTPTRAGTQVSINIPSLLLEPNSARNPLQLPLLAQLVGNEQLQSEELIAYELGHRWKKENYGIDVSLYFNDYKKLHGTEFGGFFCHPSNNELVAGCQDNDQLIIAPLIFNNSVGGHTLGAELGIYWSPTSRLDLRLNYSFIDYQLDFEPSPEGFRNELAEERNLQHLANVQLNYQLTQKVSLSVWGRYAGRIEGIANIGTGFDAYTTADIQIDWALSPTTRISVTGINLIDDDQLEYSSELGEVDTLPVPRMIRASIELSF